MRSVRTLPLERLCLLVSYGSAGVSEYLAGQLDEGLSAVVGVADMLGGRPRKRHVAEHCAIAPFASRYLFFQGRA